MVKPLNEFPSKIIKSPHRALETSSRRAFARDKAFGEQREKWRLSWRVLEPEAIIRPDPNGRENREKSPSATGMPIIINHATIDIRFYSIAF